MPKTFRIRESGELITLHGVVNHSSMDAYVKSMREDSDLFSPCAEDLDFLPPETISLERLFDLLGMEVDVIDYGDAGLPD